MIPYDDPIVALIARVNRSMVDHVQAMGMGWWPRSQEAAEIDVAEILRERLPAGRMDSTTVRHLRVAHAARGRVVRRRPSPLARQIFEALTDPEVLQALAARGVEDLDLHW